MKDVIRIFLRNSNIEMKSNLTIADFDPRFGDGVRRRCRLLPRPQSDHGRHQRGELQVGPFFFQTRRFTALPAHRQTGSYSTRHDVKCDPFFFTASLPFQPKN